MRIKGFTVKPSWPMSYVHLKLNNVRIKGFTITIKPNWLTYVRFFAPGKDSDDGQYFEVDEKGQLRLKQGKKKIDLSKLTDEDLRRLGIDPSLSKQEIARLLKVGGDGGGTGPCPRQAPAS